MRVVLGSSSKWRQHLFAQHFADQLHPTRFNFPSADIDEKQIRHHVPEQMVIKIANAKMDAILRRWEDEEHILLVCMDQVVRCNGAIREKPETEAQAREYLDSYRNGLPAECINGVVVGTSASDNRVEAYEISRIFFKPFPDEVIDHLITQKDVFTCAGGFVMEDAVLSQYIDRIEGTAEAVQGLPVLLTSQLIFHMQSPEFQMMPTQPIANIQLVIFDMDGLILNTEAAYTLVQSQILRRYNREFTWEMKAKMMGRKATESVRWLIDYLGLHGEISPEEFLAERERMLEEMFEKCAVMPGAEKLITHLKANNVPIVLATSSHSRHFQLKTTNHKALFANFDHIITGDQVAQGKPHPEIFQLASTKAGMFDPSSVLVLEDAPLGVEAAIRAGMHVTMVPDPKTKGERGVAHHEIASLCLFNPSLWGLPPFQ